MKKLTQFCIKIKYFYLFFKLKTNLFFNKEVKKSSKENKEISNNCFRKLNKNSNKLWFQKKILAQTKESKLYVRINHPDIYFSQIENRSNGGLSGDYQWRRLAELDLLLKFFKIKSAIEFGSGTSSYIFAKNCSNFLTLEENSHFHSKMLNNAPPNLKAYLIQASVLSERKIISFLGESCTCYEWSLEQTDKFDFKKVDFVYVDGPFSDLKKGDIVKDPPAEKNLIKQKVSFNMANVDVLILGKKSGGFPKIIAIDGRRPTLKYFYRSLPQDFIFFCKSEYDFPRRKLFLKSPLIYHSLFIKKETLKNFF